MSENENKTEGEVEANGVGVAPENTTAPEGEAASTEATDNQSAE